MLSMSHLAKNKTKNPPGSEIENVRYMGMADYNLCKIIYVQKLPRVQNKCINFQYIILHDKEIKYFWSIIFNSSTMSLNKSLTAKSQKSWKVF